MITQDLIDYIKLQKLQGKDAELIKNSLLANSWSEFEINQAFLQINNPIASIMPSDMKISQPAAFLANQPQFQQYIQPPDTSKISNEEKDKIIKAISILILLIASLYIISTVRVLVFTVIIDSPFFAREIVFSILKYFPSLGGIPIMLSFVSLFFFYLALKVRNGSKFSLWLSIISLLHITDPSSFTCY